MVYMKGKNYLRSSFIIQIPPRKANTKWSTEPAAIPASFAAFSSALFHFVRSRYIPYAYKYTTGKQLTADDLRR